jgi:hypothetical protein
VLVFGWKCRICREATDRRRAYSEKNGGIAAKRGTNKQNPPILNNYESNTKRQTNRKESAGNHLPGRLLDGKSQTRQVSTAGSFRMLGLDSSREKRNSFYSGQFGAIQFPVKIG